MKTFYTVVRHHLTEQDTMMLLKIGSGVIYSEKGTAVNVFFSFFLAAKEAKFINPNCKQITYIGGLIKK